MINDLRESQELPPPALLNVQNRTANRFIWGASVIVFAIVLLLNRVQIPAPSGLDIHLFAKVNAILNTTVSVLLIGGLVTAKAGRWRLHRALMIACMLLSAAFLLSYIIHHLFSGDTPYGGQGLIRWVYYFVLITHILLAAGSLPFILTTAYRGLSGQYPEHRRIARKVWPIWFYVSVSGVIVYLMISPYY